MKKILISVVTSVTGITKEQILSRKKTRDIAEIRMMCTNILQEQKPELKLTVLSGLMGLKHCSANYHQKTHRDLMIQPDGKYKDLFNKLRLTYKRTLIVQDRNYKNVLIEKRKKLQEMLEEINQVLE